MPDWLVFNLPDVKPTLLEQTMDSFDDWMPDWINVDTPPIPPDWREKVEAYGKTPEFAAFQRQLDEAANHLQKYLSHIPWHQERAEKEPGYWRRLAASAPRVHLKR